MEPDIHTTAGKLADLDARIEAALNAASPEAVEKQHARGKMTARERIHALLDDCGLAFDPACLAHHQARRSVRTASAAQVRQPLRHDTARTDAYGALLDPLRAALGLPDH